MKNYCTDAFVPNRPCSRSSGAWLAVNLCNTTFNLLLYILAIPLPPPPPSPSPDSQGDVSDLELTNHRFVQLLYLEANINFCIHQIQHCVSIYREDFRTCHGSVVRNQYHSHKLKGELCLHTRGHLQDHRKIWHQEDQV